MTEPSAPLLSIVVVIVSDTIDPAADTEHLTACLEALERQSDAPDFEVIVPHHTNTSGLDALRARFPHVRLMRVDEPVASSGEGGGREHHDVLRARGMTAARGELIGLLEDHALPDERWCANVVAAHRESAAAIGGAVENGIDRPLNWAVYFCDFGRYQNPVPAGDSDYASDANVVYKRAALDSVRDTWEEAFREVVVNTALRDLGEKVVLDPGVLVHQNRSGLRLGEALRERYVWGRSYAETRSRLLTRGKTLVFALAWPAIPFAMLLRLGRTAWQRRRHFGRFMRALPTTVLLLLSWSVGEGVGYLKSL